MSHEYHVHVYNTDGTQMAIFDDFNSLYYYKRLNDYGYHTFSVSGDDDRRTLFGVDTIIEVRRRNVALGIPWYTDYAAFHRTSQDQVTDRGVILFTSYGRAFEDLIHRRFVEYSSGTAFDTKTGPADDVMKAFVRENAGPLALVSLGRLRDGVTIGLNVEADVGQGPTWTGSLAFKNLHESLLSISQTAKVDYDVVWQGGQNFLFRTHYPRAGTDRTGADANIAPVTFAIELGNVTQPFLTETHIEEANSILVMGSGQGTDRAFVVRDNTTAQKASPWNIIERAHDARNAKTTEELETTGDAQLQALRATREISFQTRESEGTAYGRDYFLGDVVLARFNDATFRKKLVGVEITVSEGKESIRPHFEDE